jgi:hypothetical protein
VKHPKTLCPFLKSFIGLLTISEVPEKIGGIDQDFLAALSCASTPSSSAPTKRLYRGNIRRQNCRKPSFHAIVGQ